MNNMEGYDRYVGQTFDGRYKIIKVIGLGGMSVVFEAYDLVAQKIVALKMLRDEYAADPQQVRRFVNESKVVSMLSHPGIVKIFNYSVRNDTKYIAMEYIEGITLKDYIQKRGVLSFNEIISYTEQILHALEHAHESGVVHRDIKPQNIMLLRNGLIKVTDFGIAKVTGGETFTITDKAIGTVSYISPEQAEGKQIDARSDLYSLGTVMYEMACGKLPFDDESPISVALMHINKAVVSPRTVNPAIPRGLEQIILSAMEKDRAFRFQSAGQMLRQIARLKADPNIVFRPNPKIQAAQKQAEEKKEREEMIKKHGIQSKSMTPIILGVVSAFALVILLTVWMIALPALGVIKPPIPPLYNLLVPEPTIYSFKMPDITGKTLAEAKKSLDEKYFEIKTDPAECDNEDEWEIVEQIPKAGSDQKIEAGKRRCKVTLTLRSIYDNGNQAYLSYESQTVSRVRNEIQRLGFKVTQVIDEHSSSVPKNQVIRTEPAAGQYLPKGTEVIIYRSLGPAGGNVTMTIVPNFVGMTEEAAKALATEQKLQLTVAYEPSNFTKGIVIRQEPGVNSEVLPNSAVTVIVSSGAAAKIAVPELSGLSEAEAKAKLEALGLKFNAEYANSATEEGKVIGQDPAANTEVSAGTTVTVTVSSGAGDKIPVPDVGGLSEAEAKAKLEQAGLKVTVRHLQSSAEAGKVIDQQPMANTEVSAGSTVTVTVSSGEAVANSRLERDLPTLISVEAALTQNKKMPDPMKDPRDNR